MSTDAKKAFGGTLVDYLIGQFISPELALVLLPLVWAWAYWDSIHDWFGRHKRVVVPVVVVYAVIVVAVGQWYRRTHPDPVTAQFAEVNQKLDAIISQGSSPSQPAPPEIGNSSTQSPVKEPVPPEPAKKKVGMVTKKTTEVASEPLARLGIVQTLAVSEQESRVGFAAMNIYYRNFGTGPASSVATRFAAGIASGEVSTDQIKQTQDDILQWSGWDDEMKRQEGIEIYPNDPGQFTTIPHEPGDLARDFSQQFEAIKNGTMRFYVFLTFKYRDSAGSVVVTETCSWFSGGNFARHLCGRERTFIDRPASISASPTPPITQEQQPHSRAANGIETLQPSLVVNCQTGPMPTQVPPEPDGLWMVQLTGAAYAPLGRYFNEKGGELKWPEETNAFAERCEVSNYSSVVLREVALQMYVRYLTAVKGDTGSVQSGPLHSERTYSLSIPILLDPKSSKFVFFVSGRGEWFTQAHFVPTASGQILGDDTVRSIKVILAGTREMTFTPTVQKEL